MAYLKPQSPLQHKDGDYFYPLTTVDQVIMEDGSRLNAKLDNLNGGGDIDIEGVVYAGDESVDSVTAPLNADTLGGKPESELSVAKALNADNALNADTLGGKTVSSIVDMIYPIGSIYMSANSVNPSTLFGGTWEQIEDTFLLAAGSTYAAGVTGGEAEHTLTVDEMPSHGHGVHVWDAAGETANAWYYNGITQTPHSGARLYNGNASAWVDGAYSADAAMGGLGDPSGSTNLVGGDKAHNNMPPYLAVYVWKRTA